MVKHKRTELEFRLDDLLFWLREQRNDPATSVDEAVIDSINKLKPLLKDLLTLMNKHEKITRKELKECGINYYYRGDCE